MKRFNITVNGAAYDVAVEELAAGAAPVAAPAPAPAAAPAPAPAAAPALAAAPAMKMENEIMCPQDGTVASINVQKGDSVNSNDLIMTLQ